MNEMKVMKEIKMRNEGMIMTFLSLLLLFICGACSHIDEADRLIYVKPDPVQRCVLLEDFTGQRCINCPRGTEVIEQLQQEYGDSILISVGIHSGPLGFAGNNTIIGLATDVGNEYYNHWQLEYQPVGLVNRHGAVNYTDWPAAVKTELSRPAPLSMKAEVSIQDNEVGIRLTMTGTDGSTKGKLQVWLVEDGITAMQLMPDGSANSQYVHNHVFRVAVNGTWGEDFELQEGETKTTNHTQVVDPSWNPANLNVVAFVYNNQGVLQAVKGKIKE